MKIELRESPLTFTVRAGDSILVEAAETATTGYTWELEARPPEAAEIAAGSWSGPDAPPGAGGRRNWTVRVLRGPVVRLEAALRRPWQRDAAPEKTASAILNVEG